MKIDQEKLRRSLLTSWGYTGLALLLTFVWVGALSLIGVRFVGASGFILAVVSLGAMMIVVFIFSELIVNLLFSARSVNPENDNEVRFKRLLDELVESTGTWVRPRAYIMDGLDVPNAMAYGMGFPFFSAVGVTPKLLELLNEDELRAVIAHELAHVKCFDVGLMTMMGVLLSIPDKLGRMLTGGATSLGKSIPAYAIGYFLIFVGKYVLGVLRFAMQQEREFAADALGASYVGDADPLIKALRSLAQSRRQQMTLFTEVEAGKGERHPLERLMVSHPGLEERIMALQALNTETLS